MEVQTIAGAIGALAPVLAYLIRLIVKKAAVIMEGQKKTHEILAGLEKKVGATSSDLSEIRPIVELMRKELQPNGGTALKDQVSSLAVAVKGIEARQRAGWAADGRATYECDGEGNCVWASDALAVLFGTSPEKMLGSGWLNRIATQDERKLAWSRWLTSVKEGIPYEDTYRIKTGDGKYRWIRAYTISVVDVGGTVSGYFGVASELSGPAPLSDAV